jgi:Aldo/keto reductase family
VARDDVPSLRGQLDVGGEELGVRERLAVLGLDEEVEPAPQAHACRSLLAGDPPRAGPRCSRANARCAEEGIVVEAHSPLTKGRRLDDSTVARVAGEVGRTPAQVLIRWSLQKGFVVLPRSSNPSRIAENAAVFEFVLDDAQIAALDALDEGLTTGWDPARQA